MGSPLKLLVSRRRTLSLWRALKPQFPTSNSVQDSVFSCFPIQINLLQSRYFAPEPLILKPDIYSYSKSFCSRSSSSAEDSIQGPTAIDYRYVYTSSSYLIPLCIFFWFLHISQIEYRHVERSWFLELTFLTLWEIGDKWKRQSRREIFSFYEEAQTIFEALEDTNDQWDVFLSLKNEEKDISSNWMT